MHCLINANNTVTNYIRSLSSLKLKFQSSNGKQASVYGIGTSRPAMVKQKRTLNPTGQKHSNTKPHRPNMPHILEPNQKASPAYFVAIVFHHIRAHWHAALLIDEIPCVQQCCKSRRVCDCSTGTRVTAAQTRASILSYCLCVSAWGRTTLVQSAYTISSSLCTSCTLLLLPCTD